MSRIIEVNDLNKLSKNKIFLYAYGVSYTHSFLKEKYGYYFNPMISIKRLRLLLLIFSFAFFFYSIYLLWNIEILDSVALVILSVFLMRNAKDMKGLMITEFHLNERLIKMIIPSKDKDDVTLIDFDDVSHLELIYFVDPNRNSYVELNIANYDGNRYNLSVGTKKDYIENAANEITKFLYVPIYQSKNLKEK